MMEWVIKMKFMLRELQEETGFTQKQVAEYLSCDRTTYSKYERGVRIFPFETAVLLSDLYGISTDYLLGRTKDRVSYPKSRRK